MKIININEKIDYSSLNKYKLSDVKEFFYQRAYEELIMLNINSIGELLEKEENGDLFYILAQVYKKTGEKEKYIKNLKNALDNNLTLTYSHNIVNKELNYIKSKENIDIEEVEEYNSTTEEEEYYDYSDDNTEYEEDYEDFEETSEIDNEYDEDSEYDDTEEIE